MKVGRPRLYNTAEELEEAIDQYLDGNETPTMAGLQLAIGMSKQAFSDYSLQDLFADSCKRARLAIESVVEGRMLYGNTAAGCIFWMKNNAGYRDQREVTGAHGGAITVVMSEEDAAVL